MDGGALGTEITLRCMLYIFNAAASARLMGFPSQSNAKRVFSFNDVGMIGRVVQTF